MLDKLHFHNHMNIFKTFDLSYTSLTQAINTNSAFFHKSKINLKIISMESNSLVSLKSKGQVKYKCELCAKSFTKSNFLKRHIRTLHEGQRNYKCNSCGKSFTWSGDLNKHMKTLHEGQKNYKCDSCGKFFSSSGYL